MFGPDYCVSHLHPHPNRMVFPPAKYVGYSLLLVIPAEWSSCLEDLEFQCRIFTAYEHHVEKKMENYVLLIVFLHSKKFF